MLFRSEHYQKCDGRKFDYRKVFWEATEVEFARGVKPPEVTDQVRHKDKHLSHGYQSDSAETQLLEDSKELRRTITETWAWGVRNFDGMYITERDPQLFDFTLSKATRFSMSVWDCCCLGFNEDTHKP